MREQLDRPLASTIREHDVHLGGLIHANPLAILVVDPTDRVQMCNPAFEALFGYREADIIGKPIDALIVPAKHTREAAGLSQRGFDGHTARSVTRRRTKDGSLVDVELTIVPLTSGGTPIGAYGIYRDLTDQKQAERQLRAQYAVVEALAHSSTIEEAAPWVLRSVAESLGWQIGAMHIFDKTANELRCIGFWHTDRPGTQFELETRAKHDSPGVGLGRAMAQPNWFVEVTQYPQFSRQAAAVAEGLHTALSFPMTLAGETVGVVEFFTTAVLESDDRILSMFAALGRQLGAFIGRSRAQEQVERFFTMSQDLLCFAGFDGYFKRVNDSWQRVLGHTSEDMLARPYLDFVHADDRDSTIAELAKLPKDGVITSFENRWRCKDGSYKWLLWNATAKPEEEMVYAVARDDTERKLVERQLRETLKMRNDFVSFVTHQLRTPLSGIKWMLELATESTDSDERLSYIQDGRESANRLIGLVNDLLDVSRLESGKLQVILEHVKLEELTEAVLSDVATLVREKGHTVTVDAPPTLPDAMLDRQLMRQVILNLISNAIKYTPPNGRIDIRICHDRASLGWSIQDSGIGIPRSAQQQLFEKFYRAENALTIDTEGTGLGLYLVRLIVERFGGTIGCTSEEGQGTLFHFTLPIDTGVAP